MASREAVAGLGVGLVAIAFVACSDSYHLDPAAAGTGAGPVTTTGSGGGGAGPILCASSTDCPAPKAVCDTIRGECVECLEIDQCPFASVTVCSKGACVCPNEGASLCQPTSLKPARCADLATSTDDCGSCGHACFGPCAEGACVDAWEPTSLEGAPAPRQRHVAVWTGSTMLVWGGEISGGYTNTGGAYDPKTGKWTPMSTANAPVPRMLATAVWTGSKMIVWGGHNGLPLGSGGVYDPATNAWAPMNGAGSPSARYSHTAVWVDKPSPRMCVFGGYDNDDNVGDGSCYDPSSDLWTPISVSTKRREHTAVWTGSHMVVFGGIGFDGMSNNQYLAENLEYDPASDAWTSATDGQPGTRARHVATWTGMAMLVWGGGDSGNPAFRADGGSYKPPNWGGLLGTPPEGREQHTAVWTGSRFIVWGGVGPTGRLGTGGLYDPVSNQWDPKGMPTGPEARTFHTAVATDDKRMIIWGGQTAAGPTNTGGIFDPKL